MATGRITFTEDMLARICEQLLGLHAWRPDIEPDDKDAVLDTLALCESHLERMFLLGAIHRIGFNAMGPIPVWPCVTDVAGAMCRGIWVREPWHGFVCRRCGAQGGPSGLVFVPQLVLRGRRWDFGIISCPDNGSPYGSLFGLVEIDGYAVHRERRRADENARRWASRAGVPVFAAYEETHSASFWIDAVMHHYWRIGEHPDAGDCISARSCEVFVPGNLEAA